MGLGKTIMMIGLILANFQKRTLVVLPVALVKQWEQQILKNTGHQALVFYGAEKKKITQEMLESAPVVITTYGHMVRHHLSRQSRTRMYRNRHTHSPAPTLARIVFMV
jgi:SNF2 family DNA or RNA helicase